MFDVFIAYTPYTPYTVKHWRGLEGCFKCISRRDFAYTREMQATSSIGASYRAVYKLYKLYK